MASQIILLPFYLNYLSAANLGVFSIYTGFSLLVQIFVTYSFDSSIYSFFHDYKSDHSKLSVFISSSFNFILIVSLITSLILAVTGHWIFAEVFSKATISFYPYGFVSVFSGIFQALFKVNSSLLQTQEKSTEFLKSNVVSFSLIALFTILGLVFFPDTLIGPIGGRLVATAISGLWVLSGIYRQFGFHFDFPMIKSTFGFNHPSLLYQIPQWFNNYFDRVLMSRYLPLAQVGIYDLAVKCLTGVELILTGMNGSFYPKVLGIVVLQKEKQSTLEINRYYNGLSALAILLVSLSILGLPWVIELVVYFIGKTDYLLALPIIPLIAITYLLRALRLYSAMPYAAMKYMKPLPVYYTIVIVVKLGLMVLLLQRYGVVGAIYSTWIGYLFEIVILYFGIQKRFAFNFNKVKLIVAPTTMALVILLCELKLKNINLEFLHTGYVILSGLVLWWTYRNELKPELFKLK
jgi:O-antigen/teichoic acid export membrane protein